MSDLIHTGNVDIYGTLRARGGILPALPRASITQEDYAEYPVPLENLRVWDAFATTLPGTSSADDLGIYTGTWAAGAPYCATSDMKTLGSVTRYARFMAQLPPEYVAGESVRIRISAGMLTTVAGVAATLDLEVYRVDRDTTIGGSDLCATAAQSINSLTFADKDFELSTSTLNPGDWLDCRIALLVNDAATGTAVIGAIGAIELMCDIQG